MRILKMNYPEWHYLVFGCFGAALYGAYPPLYGVAFGKMYDVSKITTCKLGVVTVVT